MEAVFFILVGGALFSQSWNLLGLLAEGRSLGILVCALALMSLIALIIDPMVIESEIHHSHWVNNNVVFKGMIILWAVYLLGSGTQNFFDLEERAVGFFSGFVSIISLVSFLYFVMRLAPETNKYGEAVWLSLSVGTLILAINAGLSFFHQAIPFHVIRLVSGWFLLVGGVILGIIGILLGVGTISL
ncbi:MAG: hypothetical protein CL880_02090 [Dehalococcoidia bacterium]|nr:hypothetical protein [Dehalococcoidia bacterium]MAX04425.1 hypothetical protein [Dehalococcoidia bacterium]|tara:strand:+ start:1510 stop:2070 length:561 start_codon:yes stop_codon:yes gene_type:complete